jgi:hypothetical protein
MMVWPSTSNAPKSSCVRVAKVVEHGDGFDDPLDGLGAERRHAWCDDRHSTGEMLTQLMIQRVDARSLAVHNGPPDLSRKV